MEHLHNSTVLVLVNQNTETPNFTTEIELVENAFYVKTGIQVKKEKDKNNKLKLRKKNSVHITPILNNKKNKFKWNFIYFGDN